MSNKNQNNSISLFQVFDDICDKAVSNFITTTDNFNYCSNSSDNCYIDPFYPYSNWKYNFDWLWSPLTTYTYHIEAPNYPVSNYAILEDGTSVIEVAVSGFETDEISVKREDLKIIVEGKKKEFVEDKKKKYIHKQIAERDFTLTFDGSSKWNFDALTVKMSKGILKIEIPIKEECKPINRTYKISE